MKRFAVTSLVLLALASCMPTTDTGQILITNAGKDEQSEDLFKRVNDYRASQGKGILLRHPGLDKLAATHCHYLKKKSAGVPLKISHVGFDGRALIAKRKLGIPSLGENVAYTSSVNSRRIVNLWIGSRKHNSTMLSAWRYSGIATCETDRGEYLAVQLFGTATRLRHPNMPRQCDRFR